MKKLLFILSMTLFAITANAQLRNGLYEIRLAANPRYVMGSALNYPQNFVNVVLQKRTGGRAQRWYLENNGDGSVSLYTSLNRNYALDLDGWNTSNGGNIHLFDKNHCEAQKWVLEKANGGYVIKSYIDEDFAIDNDACKQAQWNNIQVWDLNYCPAQVWKFVRIK